MFLCKSSGRFHKENPFSILLQSWFVCFWTHIPKLSFCARQWEMTRLLSCFVWTTLVQKPVQRNTGEPLVNWEIPSSARLQVTLTQNSRKAKRAAAKKKVDTFHFSQPGYLSSWVRAPYPPSMAVIYFGKASVRLSSCQRQTFASSAWKRMFYRGFFSQSLGFITVLGALHTEINYHKCRHLFLCRWAVILCVSSAWKFFFF